MRMLLFLGVAQHRMRAGGAARGDGGQAARAHQGDGTAQTAQGTSVRLKLNRYIAILFAGV